MSTLYTACSQDHQVTLCNDFDLLWDFVKNNTETPFLDESEGRRATKAALRKNFANQERFPIFNEGDPNWKWMLEAHTED